VKRRKKRESYLWLNRRIAAGGPHLTLCLSQAEFESACVTLGVKTMSKHAISVHSSATTHFFRNKNDGQRAAIVCLGDTKGDNAIEIAGLLVHEAVHVWQDYASDIGEVNPGEEQEAYAIQAIAQELMAEYARRKRRAK
jgi:hypothetical protein